RSGGHPELLLEVLEELAQLEHGHAGDGVEDLFLGGHGHWSSWGSGVGSVSAGDSPASDVGASSATSAAGSGAGASGAAVSGAAVSGAAASGAGASGTPPCLSIRACRP